MFKLLNLTGKRSQFVAASTATIITQAGSPMASVAADDYIDDAIAVKTSNQHSGTKQPRNTLFNPHGRIGVLSYNARNLLGMAIGVLGLVPFFALDPLTGDIQSSNPVMLIGAGILLLAGIIVCLMLTIYSAIKRLHDLNMNGWFYLLGMIPLVGVFFFAYYALMPSKKGDNRFGSTIDATTAEKIFGVIGILLVALIVVTSLLSVVGIL